MVSYQETSIDHLDLLLQVASTQNTTSLTSSFLAFVVIGNILIYVIPSVSFVVLVIIGCGVYCLCCRNRKRKSYEREDRKMQRRREEIKQRHAERRAERKVRTDAMRQKYGLLANDDDAEIA